RGPAGRPKSKPRAKPAAEPSAQIVAGLERKARAELRGPRPLQAQRLRRRIVARALAEVDQPTRRTRTTDRCVGAALDHADAVALHLHLDLRWPWAAGRRPGRQRIQ